MGDQRSAIGNSHKLAAIEIEQGDLAAAEATLEACRPTAEQFRDRRRLGELHLLTAQLAEQRGDAPAARAALEQAVDLFERLGMRGDLAEAQAALAKLAQDA